MFWIETYLSVKFYIKQMNFALVFKKKMLITKHDCLYYKQAYYFGECDHKLFKNCLFVNNTSVFFF